MPGKEGAAQFSDRQRQHEVSPKAMVFGALSLRIPSKNCTPINGIHMKKRLVPKVKHLVAVPLVSTFMFLSPSYGQTSKDDEVRIGSTARAVCLTSSGRLARKSACGNKDTELVVNQVKKSALPKTGARGGTSVLGPKSVKTVSQGVEARTNVQSATSLVGTVGQSLRAYTFALTFSSSWTGDITTACGDFEAPISASAVAYKGNKMLASGRTEELPVGEVAFNGVFSIRESDGSRTHYHPAFETITGDNIGRIYDTSKRDGMGNVVFDIPSDITMYVTQVCAPLSRLENRK